MVEAASAFVVPGIGAALLATALTIYARRPFRSPITIPTATESQPMDLANPYAAATASAQPHRFDWPALRGRCRYVRMANNVCWSAAGLMLLTALGLAWFRPAMEAVLPLFLLAGTIVGVFGQSLWETPTRNKALSFARQAVRARGVPNDHVENSLFIGMSRLPTGEGIGNSSDHIGFIQFSNGECVIHTTDSDIVVSRAHVVRVERVKPVGESMAWFGLRLVALTLQSEIEPNPVTLYLIAWGGESAFAIARATDLLHQQVANWRTRGAPPVLPPRLEHS